MSAVVKQLHAHAVSAPAPASIEKIQSALSAISPEDRDVWVRQGMAIKNALGDAGFWLWDDWSQGSESYHAASAKSVWKSIKVGGKTGIGSLFYMAKEKGWTWDRPEKKLSAAELEAIRESSRIKAEAAAAEKLAEQIKVSEQALAIWNAAKPATAHPYLVRKKVAAHGLRVGKWEVTDHETGEVRVITQLALLVPIRDRSRLTWSLQAIMPNGSKLFLAGGAKAGHFFPIGKPKDHGGRNVWILAEGYATGASIHETTGHCVLVAFDTSNLLPVASAIRERQPDAIILFAADNDRFTKRKDGTPYNPGVEAATKAAKAVGGYLAIPEFELKDQTGLDDEGRPVKRTDWNDWHVLHGQKSLKYHIDKALERGPVAPGEVDDAPDGPDADSDSDNAPGTDAGEVLADASCEGQTQGAPAPRRTRQGGKGEGKTPVFGDPIDLFNIALPPQVPLSVLPNAIAAYAKDQASLLGCDHSIIGMAALVAAAACITDGIKLQPKRMDPTWTESARLWLGIVGDPSTKKSPSIGKAVRHVKRLEARFTEQNGAAYGDWKCRHEQWKKASKGKDVLPEPKQPPMKRLIVEDTTVEALSDVLKDNDRGVLCLQDELTGWFASMDAYKGGGRGGNKDRAKWLEIYNGGQQSIDRVARGSISVPNWSACVLGGIQPDMMRRIANGMGNDGLLQRFMIVVAKPAQKGEDRYPDRVAMDNFGALFDHLEGISSSEQPVTMVEGAHQVRERIEDCAAKMAKAFDHPHMQAWLGKWEGLFARLTLTYHAIECMGESVYPNEKQVRAETAEKVERLMCGTLLHHAIHFYNEIVDASDRYSNMRQLARLILARGMSVVTKRDLHIYWRASRSLQAWEVKSIIDSLCNMDWLHPDEEAIDATDGKPKSWFVNPKVHEVFAENAVRERARREDAVEALRAIKKAYSDAGMGEQP
jgi:phage/plasmid primase-like uncharacterized protein